MTEPQTTETFRQFEIPAIPSAAQSASILTVVFLITAITGYIFNIILGWFLPLEQYGTYGVCVALYGILALFISVAFPWAVAKFLASESSDERKHRVFKSSLVGNQVTAIVVTLLFYTVYASFPARIGIERSQIFLILILVILSASLSVYQGALQGLFRFKQMGAMQLLAVFLRLVSGGGLVIIGYGVLGALAGYLVAASVTLLINVYLLRDFRFWQGKGWDYSRILTFAPVMFLGTLGITLLSNLDILGVKFLMGKAVSGELAGYYQSALMLARIPLLITGAIMMAMFPFISRYAESGSRDYSLMSLKYTVFFIIPISIAVALRPALFITLFFPQVYSAGADALRVVAIGMGFLSLAQVLASTFQALGKPRIPAIALVVVSGIQMIALVVLIPRLGLLGAASATTIACFLGLSWLFLRYLRLYRLGIKWAGVVRVVVAFGIPGYLLYILPLEGRLLTIVSAIIIAIIYASLLALLKLVDERDLDILALALPQSQATNTMLSRVKRLTIRLNGVVKF